MMVGGGGGLVVLLETTMVLLLLLLQNASIHLCLPFFGLSIAKRLGYQNFILEGDASKVFRPGSGLSIDISVSGIVLENINVLVSFFQSCILSWRRRSANMAAHLLAKFSKCLDEVVIWLDFPPDCIGQVLASEAPIIV